jgi:pyrroline-5-carboxylate reductase
LENENDMSLQDKKVAVIGIGNMAEALIRGLLAAKTVTHDQLWASDTVKSRRQHCMSQLKVRAFEDNAVVTSEADVVVLAVKPQQMSGVLASIKPQISNSKLIISIAAGVTTARIESELGGKPRVIRVMPNTPALVGAGAAALAKGEYATDDDLQTAETILKAVGLTVRVDEKLFDAVTALSGSGPAYVFYVAEAMIQAGVEAGLPAEVAKKLALQTVFGAGKLLVESSDAPDALRKKVTSPGGTTEAALKVMTERNLIGIFKDAIKAAEKRSRELSGL